VNGPGQFFAVQLVSAGASPFVDVVDFINRVSDGGIPGSGGATFGVLFDELDKVRNVWSSSI